MRIFNQTIEWYDIKTKFKKILRSITYAALIQQAICFIIMSYMWLVYITSKKKFINIENFLPTIKEGRPIIIASWHNRLMMVPFMARLGIKNNPQYKFMTLASHHGDGQFVGRVMKNFGFQNIYGSSKDGRKASRGIDVHSLRELIRGLKNGKGLGITPDGPRGPNQKINSEIINIAKIANAAIIPVSYSSSKFKIFNSWDKFKLPLPFGRLCFYFGDLIKIRKDINGDEETILRKELESKLNEVQKLSENNL